MAVLLIAILLGAPADGPYVEKWPNGKVKFDWVYWFKSGKKQEQRHYRKGRRHLDPLEREGPSRVARGVQARKK